MHIKDSVILITGAAVRVGRAVALHLAEHGAHISFSYYDDQEPWQATLTDIQQHDVDALATQTEVLEKASVQHLVERTVEAFGRVDVLINNASVWLKSPFLDITEEAWDLALGVNLKGPFLCAQAVAPLMMAQGAGVILNITDLSAFQVWPQYAHHAASKAGLVALTKSLAVELAPDVRVNAIAPGTVLLPENCSESKREWAVENSLLKRVGCPQDVAQLMAFLIESDFLTGSVYFVDGGRSLV